MRLSHHNILSSSIIFLLGVIPPSLGVYGFYRYEDFYHLAFVKDTIPDFSWHSFIGVFSNKLFGYYRPGALFTYWISYLIAGNDPFIFHILASVTLGIIAVELYWIGRFFSGNLGGWVTAISFICFEPVVILSWWTGTFDIFPAILCFLLGLIIFFYHPFPAYISLPIAYISLSFAIFTKETFIPLSIIFFLFCISSAQFKTKFHYRISIGVWAIGLLKLISQAFSKSVVGDHIHQSIFDIDLTIAFLNIYDYWRLLIHSHSIYLVILGLIFSIQSKQNEFYLFLYLLVAAGVLIVNRMVPLPGVIEVGVLILCIIHFFTGTLYLRIWILWVFIGFIPLIMYDIRIVGGIMNRRVIESSIGFSLFFGAVFPSMLTFIWSQVSSAIHKHYKPLLNISKLILRYRLTLLIVIYLFVGIRQEVKASGIQRELRYWIAEGEVLREAILAIGQRLPANATLLAEPMPGMQVISQIENGLYLLFDRRDISVQPIDGNAKAYLNDESKIAIYTVSSKPINKIMVLRSDEAEVISTVIDPTGAVSTVVYIYRLPVKQPP